MRLRACNTALAQHNAGTSNKTESQRWFSATARATGMTSIGDADESSE